MCKATDRFITTVLRAILNCLYLSISIFCYVKLQGYYILKVNILHLVLHFYLLTLFIWLKFNSLKIEMRYIWTTVFHTCKSIHFLWILILNYLFPENYFLISKVHLILGIFSTCFVCTIFQRILLKDFWNKIWHFP